MKAIKYMRWSSDKQSRGSSLDRQAAEIDGMLAGQDWSVVDTVIDEGVSAYSGANMFEGKLAKLREHFLREGGDGYVLIAEQIDRISRLDTITVIEFFIEMTRTGLTIALADNKMIVDAKSLKNQTAQLEEIVREANRANREAQVKGNRSRGAWKKMRLAGRKVHTSSTCPAWLFLIDKSRSAFGIREEKAQIVRDIFRAYIEGKSKRAIARDLNERNVPPFRGAKLGWQPSAIVALLSSRSVIGEYQHRSNGENVGDPDPTYFPQIVSNEMWQQAIDARHAKVMTGRGRDIRHRNVLSDLAVCGVCGWRMRMNRKTARAKPGHATTYVQCSNYDLRKGCSHKKMHRLDPIENALLDKILTLALDDQVWSNNTALSDLSSRLANMRRALDDLSTRLGNLVREVERRPSDRVQTRLEELEDEERNLLIAIASIEEQIALARGAVSPPEHLRRVADIRADLTRNDDEGLRARMTVKKALNDLVEKIEVQPSGIANAMLKEGLRHISIRPSGEVWDFDLKHRERLSLTQDRAVRAYLDRLQKT